eukprot:TRINITY_DN6294_c0_g1_i2.p1 TRINITY_DN6294_c0_g1~~TRINITY_DN6294_c0_g1_i2.p1  ORF type:complete len:261 (+),score=29.56 TRINITY_DN6294_c0_g1_i2:451-1233(+)
MFRPHRNSIRKSVLGVVVLVLLYILWNLGSSYRETDFTFSEFTPNQKQKWDILAPICEHIPSTSTTPTLNKIEMQMSIEDLDRTDTKSLEKFCSPFYYSRIQTFDYARDDKANCEANEKVRPPGCSWYHMCIWDPEDDIYISKTIHMGQVWEGFLVDEMMKVLTNTDKGIVIDAGANIGVYTILAASTGKTVFSFEPIPQHTEMIRRSLALNGWSNRVHLYRNGLADFRSKMKINFHTFNKGYSLPSLPPLPPPHILLPI